jgi:transposase-like protein
MVKNLKDLMAKFSDDNKCREFLIQQRWNGEPECPKCGHKKVYTIDGGKRFKCANNKCYSKFSVTVGTVFEASNIPLSTWFPAMYLIASHKKGISSVQLAKDLGVTQKTAWFMLHRIRESLKDKNSQLLTGTVEVDETYMARKYRSDYKGLPPEEVEKLEQKNEFNKRINLGAVIGMKERNGKIVVKAALHAKAHEIGNAVKENVATSSMLMTDESMKYRKVLKEYERQTVNHSKREWVRGNVYTNGVENFWSVMKRGVYGIYHQISYKHLQRYCDEFSYRYNSRELSDGNRFELTLQRVEGRLSYKQLINGNKEEETN